MKFFTDLLTNRVFLSAVIGWAAAQLIKVIIEIRKGTFSLQRLTGSGGMPSTHSATTSALAAAVCFQDGPHSSAFVIALFLAFIVMYDSMGVRFVTGEQSKVINRISKDKKKLPEKMGHTLGETAAGCVIGIVIACIICNVMPA